MPLRWKLFRLTCILQMIAAGFKALEALLTFFQHISFGSIVGVLLFSSILMLTMLAINLLNNNYPDSPVEGRQKKVFNRLFLLNFVFSDFFVWVYHYRSQGDQTTCYIDRRKFY